MDGWRCPPGAVGLALLKVGLSHLLVVAGRLWPDQPAPVLAPRAVEASGPATASSNRLGLACRPSTDEEELLARVDWFVTKPPQSARLQAELEDLWASWGPEGPPANAGMMYMLPGPLPANFGPETVAITEEELDTVVIPAPPAEDGAGGEGAAAADSGGGVVHIVAPAHREELFTQTLELPAPVTLRALLGALSDFYCRPLTAAEVEAARAGVEEDS